MKDNAYLLLSLLANSQDVPVSDLCQALQVNISGLNAVRMSLPADIQENIKQKGAYWQLKHSLAIFNSKDFKRFAHDWRIDVENECTSTNQLLSERAKNNDSNLHQSVLICNQQTQGKGRQGKEWISVLGHNISFSFVWHTTRAQNELGAVSLIVALSCYRVLREYNIPVEIKWPNDLVVGDKKLAGILVESVKSPKGSYLIIGIGINFQPSPLLPDFVTTVNQYNSKINAATLVEKLLIDLSANLRNYFIRDFSVFHADFTDAHRDQNKTVTLYNQEKILTNGVALGVNSQGALIVENNQGEVQAILSGEISLKSSVEIFTPKAKQILLLDAGNSQLKWSWVINDQIISTLKTPYLKLGALKLFIDKHPYISAIYGSAVCGETKKNLIARQLNQMIKWLHSSREACGIFNHYHKPEEHGADRWFNVIGSRTFTNNACVVVSCGTAVTIDALTVDNQYLGGSILPGFNLMKESLISRTANLDRPSGKVYPFATTTANAIASGMIDAVLGAILLMHQRLSALKDQKKVDIILTGGGARKILASMPDEFLLDTEVKIVDNLVAYGLLRWVKES